MVYKWESEEERLLKFIKMVPKKKMEWLRELKDFNSKYLPPKTKLIQKKIRNDSL